jgi:ribonuclease J
MNQLSFIPLGGIGDVTKNMYLYEYQGQILIVDCGLGFADETMLGVELLLPDISYLLKRIRSANVKIIGMVLTHGHEDHMGALPFILPRLPNFPIFTTPLTAALSNEKLKEFGVLGRVQSIAFGENDIQLGAFKISFIRVTHSVPDSSNIFIKTPIGNFYHASDFKFDLTPFDGKKTDFAKITAASKEGIMCLMSDCLGAEREGHTPSERILSENIEQEMRETQGKFILTTYSSNISRLNQAIHAAKKQNRKVCFVGRSLVKVSKIAQKLGYMKLEKDMEIEAKDIKNCNDKELLLLVAGSQGQQNSALARIANGEHREIRISPLDVVVFSADPIPGNELSINSLIDSIAKKGTRVVYSKISDDFHVSGHASSEDLMLMMSITNPKKVLPIGGTYSQMVAYKNLARKQGFSDDKILLIENGQEMIFSKDKAILGKKIELGNIYVDEISEEVIDHFVIRDRQQISKEGVVIIMAEVSAANGQIVGKPNIITRGLSHQEQAIINKKLTKELESALSRRLGRVADWVYIRKRIGEVAEDGIFKSVHRRPLVLPVVIEV